MEVSFLIKLEPWSCNFINKKTTSAHIFFSVNLFCRTPLDAASAKSTEALQDNTPILMFKQNFFWLFPQCKKCPNSELFWSAFFPHLDWIRRDTPYLFVFSLSAEKCRKNVDQNNSEYGHFLRNVLYKERNDLRVFHNIFGLPMLVYTFACLQ